MNLYNIWNIKKQKINSTRGYLNPKIREIWWYNLGMNIGKEIYGNGIGFLRPVLVINTEIPNMFIGIPLTTKLYAGKHKVFIFTNDNKKHGVIFCQIRSFDRRRLVHKMYTLSKNKYKKLFKQFKILYIK
ncbi:type II toxin-antitoxin system PemK/MazF family toxin [Arenimonas sp.]|nr:type II toxin-antitoxin system PemK/MazF family toxin [Candidatus Parcubacteria bacterium]